MRKFSHAQGAFLRVPFVSRHSERHVGRSTGGTPDSGNPTVSTTMKMHGFPDILLTEDGEVVRAPELTLIVDVHTRAVLGFHLTT